MNPHLDWTQNYRSFSPPVTSSTTSTGPAHEYHVKRKGKAKLE
jgi:hypothetical protein